MPSVKTRDAPIVRISLYLPAKQVQELRIRLLRSQGSANLSHWVRKQLEEYLK